MPADHDAYIAAAPEALRPLLVRLRTQLARTLPDAEEVIAYKMPGFKIGDAIVAGYAAFSKQCGLYLAPAAIKAHADDIAAAGLKSTKTGVTFSPSQPIPDKLVKKLALAARKDIKLLANTFVPVPNHPMFFATHWRHLVLLLAIVCHFGCSPADQLTPPQAGTSPVSEQTNKHQDPTPTNHAPKLWPISIEGKWGFIDAAGNVKIPIQYARAEPFREGLALVSVFGTSKEVLEKNRSYDGFIDESGGFVIPAEFPAFINRENYFDFYRYSSFADGVAVVDDASGTFAASGLIDRQGNLIAPMMERSLDWFGEGLCYFEAGKKRGYMDYQGKVVITPKGFLYGSEFSEGRAVITVRKKQDDQELLIDRQGNVIAGPPKFESISRIKGGFACVVKDGEAGLIDPDGRVVVPFGEYDRITEPYPGTTYLVEKNGVCYALRANAESLKLPDFGAEPIRFCDELILLRTSDRKYGFAKEDGTIVVPAVYNDLASAFQGELCKFYRGKERGYVNRAGKVVWSTENWELPLQYSIREPLQSYLPNFGLEALPLSYNWDCKNAIVFVCDGNAQQLREYYLKKQSAAVEVNDWTNFESEPGKVELWLYFEGVSKLEVYAMHGDTESKNGEETNNFIEFYSCKNMDALRKKFPEKTIGIVIEN